MGLVLDLPKPIFGLLAGFLIGTLVIGKDAGLLGILAGTTILCLSLMFIGTLDMLVAIVPWIILLLIESAAHLSRKLLAPLEIAQVYGGGFLGSVAETTARLFIIYLVGLVLGFPLIRKATSDGTPKPKELFGCVGIIALIIWSILWWIVSATGIAGAWVVLFWMLGGLVFGFVVGKIPYL